MMNVKGFYKWNKATLRDYVEANNLTTDQTFRLTRKDYIGAIKKYNVQFKNLNRKTLDELIQIVYEQELEFTPTGKQGQILRKDLFLAIKSHASLVSLEEVRRFNNNYDNLLLKPNRSCLELAMFYNTNKLIFDNIIAFEKTHLGFYSTQTMMESLIYLAALRFNDDEGVYQNNLGT